MVKFEDYLAELKNISNFANADNFEHELDIIKSTLKYEKHTMLVGEDYNALSFIYNDLSDMEKVDLLDYFNFEKGYAGHNS